MKKLLLLLSSFLSFQLYAQQSEIRGTVFEDRNRNGIQEASELGIPDVVVSNPM